MPLSFQIRIHPRARHVRLRVDPRVGVIVTVPKRFDQRKVAALVAQRHQWIEAVQARMAAERAQQDQAVYGARPERIELAATGETWSVVYEKGSGPIPGFKADQDQLVFRLPVEADGALDQMIAETLRQWLKTRARQALVPMVRALAREHGFSHGRITIRNQRSRWGSCSARGNLSLNARLLFASPAACRYVLIHELVHTEHLDHSPSFWSRVAELDPGYRRSMAELKTVWHQLPDWLCCP